MGKIRIATIGETLEDEEKDKKEKQKIKKEKELAKERAKKEQAGEKEIKAESKVSPEEKEKEVKKEVSQKAKEKVSKPKQRSKKYQEVKALIEERDYEIGEALELLKKISAEKFDTSIEAHIKLGIDVSKSEQHIRGTINIPTGKVKKTLVFTTTKEKEAKAAGADFVGGEELIEKVAKGLGESFEIVIATPEIMPKIGKLGKTLGQRGLMPNPKSGTITPEPEKLIKEIKAGRVEFRSDPQGIVHQIIGKASFKNEDLVKNFETLLGAVLKAKPASLKGEYIQNITICSSMGPGIKVAHED